MDDLTARIEALEIRVTHGDATIEDLNATIIAQWRAIDALLREVARIADQLGELGQRERPKQEPPPPHY